MNRALFLDRDGIFNKVVYRNNNIHSPNNWNEVVHETGLEVLSEIKALGYKLILITNQPDIERKIISKEFVEELNDYYRQKYSLDAVYYCPFSSDSHPDKKPNPGMLKKAALDHKIDLKQSFFLGDSVKDQGCAEACQTAFILLDRPYNSSLKPAFRIHAFNELLKILKN